MSKTAVLARLGLCASLAIATLPAAAGFLFPFTANNVPYTSANVGGTSFPIGLFGTVDIAGTLVADQTGPTTYTITGLQDFSVTATSTLMQNIYNSAVTLDAGGAPSGPSTISWDGVTATNWSLNSNVSFFGSTSYSETLFLSSTIYYGLVGPLPNVNGDSDIQVSGDWVPGAATQQVPVPPTLPLVAAGMGLVGWLRRRSYRPNALKPVIQHP